MRALRGKSRSIFALHLTAKELEELGWLCEAEARERTGRSRQRLRRLGIRLRVAAEFRRVKYSHRRK